VDERAAPPAALAVPALAVVPMPGGLDKLDQRESGPEGLDQRESEPEGLDKLEQRESEPRDGRVSLTLLSEIAFLDE
jgi:hypothetical protein